MRFRFLLLAMTAAAVLPVVSGCGSSNSSASATQSETAPAILPKAEYARKADRICEGDASEQAVIATEYLEQHPNAQEADLVVPAGIPPLEKEIRELRQLGLPQGQEERAEVFLEEGEEALQALKDKPSRALSEKANPYKKANELGEKLGLGDCSVNP